MLAGVVIDLSGVPVLLRADDPARADAVASLFRHAPVAPGAAPLGCVEFTAESLVPPPSPATTTTKYAALWHTAPGTLWIRSEAGLVARCDDGAVAVGGSAPGLAREFRFVCLMALTHLLAGHGLYLLHGGAVVLDGRAVVVLGDTGTGKSTLAYAAHLRAWPVLADDAVLVRLVDGIAQASGLPRPISVGADVVVDAIPGGRPVPDDVRTRTELPAGTLATTTNPVAALLVMTGVDPRGPGIDPMRGPDVLRRVLQASTSLADPARRPELFAMAGALARLPTWSVRHGSDPGRALDDANVNLDALTDRLRGARPVRHRHAGS